MHVLIFADIVGRIGRRAIQQVLPAWKAEYQPVLTIANIENLAHGAGITPITVEQMVNAGIDAFTGGNHMWDKPSYMDVFANEELAKRIVRPLNEIKVAPGEGMRAIEKEGVTFTLMNVMGQVFFKHEYPSPFEALDEALEKADKRSIILLDIHAEATSEKALLSRYVDGRVSVVWGSHTHVPTADERILPEGTAAITDIGLTGAHNESIGIRYDQALAMVKDGERAYLTPPNAGPAEVNAILLTFEEGERFPSSIKRLREIVDIPEEALD